MNVGTPGCPVYLFDGLHGRPRACPSTPTHTAVIRWHERRCWVRVFPCAVHAADLPGAEPMGPEHHELLADRREDCRRALAGLGYRGVPASTTRDGV